MEIFVSRNGEKHGPYTVEQVQSFLASGQMQASDNAWYEGVDGWVSLSQVPGVSSAMQDLSVAPMSPSVLTPPPAHVANVVTPTIMCSLHPDRPAAGACAYSGKFYCKEELVMVGGRQYGRENLDHVMADVKENANRGNTAAPMVFMNAGGGSSAATSSAAVATSGIQDGVSPYSKTTAILLCCCGFVGLCGLHRAYTGQISSGVIQFFTLGGFVIWQIIDLMALLGGSFCDGKGRPLR